MTAWHFGNAGTDGLDHRGWFVGHFIRDTETRRSDDVEIKWGVHPAGEERDGWQDQETRTTVLILVRGRFRLDLPTASHVLEREGDYAIWGAGIGHSWRAEEDSVVITVRWPSVGA